MWKPNIMNSLKKNFSGIIFLVVVLGIVFLTLTTILFRTTKKKFSFLTSPYDYLLVVEDKGQINVPIFIDDEESSYMQKDNITDVYIESKKSQINFLVSLKEIENGPKTTFEDNCYYQYNLTIDLPFVSDELMILKEVYLMLKYENDKSISLPIGSICMCKENTNNELNYQSLKGIVKEYKEKNMLMAVLIKLQNNDNFTINNIRALSSKVKINMEDSGVVDIDNLVLLDNYEIVGSDSKKDIDVSKDDYLIIYLKYDEYESLSYMGFIIDYTSSNKTMQKIIYPFKYFSTKSEEVKIEKTIYELDKH